MGGGGGVGKRWWEREIRSGRVSGRIRLWRREGEVQMIQCMGDGIFIRTATVISYHILSSFILSHPAYHLLPLLSHPMLLYFISSYHFLFHPILIILYSSLISPPIP